MKWWAWIVVAGAVLAVIYRNNISRWIDEQEAGEASQPLQRLKEELAAANTGDLVNKLVNEDLHEGDFIHIEDRNRILMTSDPKATSASRTREFMWWPPDFYDPSVVEMDGKYYRRGDCGCGDVACTHLTLIVDL